MYFVGIDISKFKHDCVVLDEIGDTILPSWSFSNDREGFSLFKEKLRSLEGDVKIGFEATGHFQNPMKSIPASGVMVIMRSGNPSNSWSSTPIAYKNRPAASFNPTCS